MKEIFMISKIWINSTGNEVSAAVGYKAIGWVETEKEAHKIVNDGRLYTRDDCWALLDPAPEYIYKKLFKFES